MREPTPAAEPQLAVAARTLERCCEIAAELLRLADDRRHDGSDPEAGRTRRPDRCNDNLDPLAGR